MLERPMLASCAGKCQLLSGLPKLASDADPLLAASELRGLYIPGATLGMERGAGNTGIRVIPAPDLGNLSRGRTPDGLAYALGVGRFEAGDVKL